MSEACSSVVQELFLLLSCSRTLERVVKDEGRLETSVCISKFLLLTSAVLEVLVEAKSSLNII